MHTLRFRMLVVASLTVLAALIIAACGGQPGSPMDPAATSGCLPVPTAGAGGCGQPGSPVDPTATVAPTEVPSATPGSEPKPIEPTPGAVITGAAQIETIELLTLESFPVQIQAHVVGYLGDGCTTLDTITQTREDDTFHITITTTRPAEAICTMQLVGFEETLPLAVAGLPAGTYTVEINGVTETFTLDVDNVLS